MNEKSKEVYGFVLDEAKPQYYNCGQGSLIMDFMIHIIPPEKWKKTTILTFYKKQMQEIESGLRYFIEQFFGGKYEDYGLTVKTVDGYQGGQHDYIIISTVRSNPFIHNPDFFTHMNRVNVALTRAKKGMIVFGNSQTLKIQRFIDKNLNIWGHFLNFNREKNRLLDYWSLESIMNKRNKERGGLYDANNLRTELHSILDELIYLQKEPKLINKHEMSLSNKNENIEREIKKVIKFLTKLSEKDIKKGRRKIIVNDYLKESTKKRSNRKYLEK